MLKPPRARNRFSWFSYGVKVGGVAEAHVAGLVGLFPRTQTLR